MAKTDFKSVDDYLASLPASTQQVLAQVRAAIRSALPEADEVISYQIPAYKLAGKAVIYFAGWKQHWSLYPVTAKLQAALGEEIAGCDVSKGTLKFPLSEPVPTALVEKIAHLRAQELAP